MQTIIEFCGNCGRGEQTKNYSIVCDDYHEGTDGKRCDGWKMGRNIVNANVVYLCVPYFSEKKGEERDAEYAKQLKEAKQFCEVTYRSGATPICSVVLFAEFLNEKRKAEMEHRKEMERNILKRCDQIWVFGSQITKDMQETIDFAKKQNMTVMYISDAQKREITGEE